MKKFLCGFAVVISATIVLMSVQSSAQVKKDKERVLQTKNWMAGVNLPH